MHISRTIGILGLAIIGCMLAGALYALMFVRIESENTEAALLRVVVDAGAEEQAKLESAKEIFALTQKEREELGRYIVSNDAVVDFIEALENLNETTGANVEVVTVNVVPAAIPDSVTEELALALSVEGTWNQVMHLLSIVETLPYSVRIGNVGLHKIGEQKGKTVYWQETVTFSVQKFK